MQTWMWAQNHRTRHYGNITLYKGTTTKPVEFSLLKISVARRASCFCKMNCILIRWRSWTSEARSKPYSTQTGFLLRKFWCHFGWALVSALAPTLWSWTRTRLPSPDWHLSTQKFISSWCGGWKSRIRLLAGLLFPEGVSIVLGMAIFFLCLFASSSLCVCPCPDLLFLGHQSYWIRTCPHELILS